MEKFSLTSLRLSYFFRCVSFFTFHSCKSWKSRNCLPFALLVAVDIHQKIAKILFLAFTSKQVTTHQRGSSDLTFSFKWTKYAELAHKICSKQPCTKIFSHLMAWMKTKTGWCSKIEQSHPHKRVFCKIHPHKRAFCKVCSGVFPVLSLPCSR